MHQVTSLYKLTTLVFFSIRYDFVKNQPSFHLMNISGTIYNRWAVYHDVNFAVFSCSFYFFPSVASYNAFAPMFMILAMLQ